MFGLNTYFAAGNSRDYVEQLFGKSQGSARVAKSAEAWTPPSYDSQTQTSARDRAISNIISIIWKIEHGEGESQSSVNEQNGYILDATGTDDADKIDMKAISAFQIDTGDGDDTVAIKAGSIASLAAGAGKDTVNLAASYLAEIDGGDGDDTIRMSGDLADGVYGGDGADTLKISADTILNVDGGDGNDTIYLEGQRIFAAGGAGDDTITINQSGSEAAELSFASGDGKDTINSNGAIDIRFGLGSYGQTSGGASLTPEDLDIQVFDNKITITSRKGEDALTINFEPGSLEGKTPQFSLGLDKGDYVLKVR